MNTNKTQERSDIQSQCIVRIVLGLPSLRQAWFVLHSVQFLIVSSYTLLFKLKSEYLFAGLVFELGYHGEHVLKNWRGAHNGKVVLLIPHGLSGGSYKCKVHIGCHKPHFAG